MITLQDFGNYLKSKSCKVELLNNGTAILATITNNKKLTNRRKVQVCMELFSMQNGNQTISISNISNSEYYMHKYKIICICGNYHTDRIVQYTITDNNFAYLSDVYTGFDSPYEALYRIIKYLYRIEDSLVTQVSYNILTKNFDVNNYVVGSPLNKSYYKTHPIVKHGVKHLGYTISVLVPLKYGIFNKANYVVSTEVAEDALNDFISKEIIWFIPYDEEKLQKESTYRNKIKTKKNLDIVLRN